VAGQLQSLALQQSKAKRSEGMSIAIARLLALLAFLSAILVCVVELPCVVSIDINTASQRMEEQRRRLHSDEILNEINAGAAAAKAQHTNPSSSSSSSSSSSLSSSSSSGKASNSSPMDANNGSGSGSDNGSGSGSDNGSGSDAESPDKIHKLEVGGESVGLRDLGPIIINPDGSARRITNWAVLTAAEKEVAWRRVRLRNARRMKTLITEMNRPGFAGMYMYMHMYYMLVYVCVMASARFCWARLLKCLSSALRTLLKYIHAISLPRLHLI